MRRALAALAVAFAGLAAPTARASDLVRVGDQRFPLRADVERLSVAYRLPAGAEQGEPDWYLVRLHLRLALDPRSGNGLAYVSALTNGRAAAQVKLETRRGAAGLETTWSTVGLLEGRVERTTSARTIGVRFRNYLQLAGVRPGRNVLTFQLERYGVVQLRSLRILPDSGIEVSPLSPARVRLELTLPEGEVAAGDRFTVRYRLTNAGDRAAQDVVVLPSFPEGVLRVVGARERRYEALRGGDRAAGAFTFEALTAGRFQVALAVRSSANRPAALVEVSVQTPTTVSGRGTSWLVAPAATLTAAALLAARRLRRRLANG
ncbi:MAG: hypothetical protein ACRDON_01530 [Gaiellaceae bacterium]